MNKTKIANNQPSRLINPPGSERSRKEIAAERFVRKRGNGEVQRRLKVSVRCRPTVDLESCQE